MVATILDRERPYLEGYAQLKSSFNILLNSAHKLDQAVPYLGAYDAPRVSWSHADAHCTESSLLTINNVAPPDMSIDFSAIMGPSTSSESGEIIRPY